MSYPTRTAIRAVSHPALLAVSALVSIVLWMPWGIGYYGWPWESAAMRFILALFVFALPLFAVAGVWSSFRPAFSLLRGVISLITLLVGLFGVFAMLWWHRTYVQPML